MRTHRPRHVVALTVLGSGFLVGCIFNNTIHNAESLYGEAENLRLAGQDSAGSVRYHEAVAKATKGYRADEDGRGPMMHSSSSPRLSFAWERSRTPTGRWNRYSKSVPIPT